MSVYGCGGLRVHTFFSQVWERKDDLPETWHHELVGVGEKDKPSSTQWLVTIYETMQQNNVQCFQVFTVLY